MAKIIIPTALRQYTAQTEEIDLSGGTVNDLLTELTQRYPDLHKHLYNEQNRLRNFGSTTLQVQYQVSALCFS